MMQFKKSNSLTIKTLHRPRIDSLIEEGIQYPILLVEAGHGYGKSAAIFSYLNSHSSSKAIWLHLNTLDNVHTSFWKKFVYSLSSLFPALESPLKKLGFPDTLSKMNTFLRIYFKEALSDASILLVIDNYSVINNKIILTFFEHLIEESSENMCIIIISSCKTDIPAICLKNSIPFYHISASDIKFTAQETAELFALYQMHLPDENFHQIVKKIDGYPLALHLISLHKESYPLMQKGDLHTNLSFTFELFQREYFDIYSEPIQKLLIKLALLPHFSFEIIHLVYSDNLFEIDKLIHNNMFISYDPTTSLLNFHSLYKHFLTQKKHLLEDAEINLFFSINGDLCYKNKNHIGAIDCYSQGKHYFDMLKVIQNITNLYVNFPLANYLLDKLELLPETFIEQYPIVYFLKAKLLVYKLEKDAAKELLLHLQDLMKESTKTDHFILLGNTYALLAGISIMEQKDDFLSYYKKAADLLPQKNPLQIQNQLIVGDCNVIMLSNHHSGSLKQMEENFHETVPYLIKIFNGSGKGLDTLYSAEAAYCTYDLAKAKQFAYLSFGQASENRQYDIMNNAIFLLIKIAFANGDSDSITEQYLIAKDYITKNNRYELYHNLDLLESWLYIKIGAPEKTTPWILKQSLSYPYPLMNSGFSSIVLAQYLISKEEYEKLLGLLDVIEIICQKRGLWLQHLNVYLYRTLGYLKLKDYDASIKAFKAAYQMAYYNNIITPFIEIGNPIRSLIDIIQKDTSDTFDMKWLHSIQIKASAYAKRLHALSKNYTNSQRQPSGEPSPVLTKRELNILQSLSQGFTREEIADFYALSINTVKGYIKNIYNKLGAINRADAIHIATKHGLL